jgi:hypothetical protein
MKNVYGLFLIFIATSCDLGGGTHGSIKSYQYPVTKHELQKAIQNIFKNDTIVRRDFRGDYYNDTENYITMTISSNSNKYEYTFRFLGDSMTWATSKNSEIFLCYIYDDKGNGGSIGNGKFKATKPEIQKDMIMVFDTFFVKKLDKELNQKHGDTY